MNRSPLHFDVAPGVQTIADDIQPRIDPLESIRLSGIQALFLIRRVGLTPARAAVVAQFVFTTAEAR